MDAAGRITFFAAVAFFINATFADNFIFDNANDIFRAVYANCTEDESNFRKCINGVCIARTDTLVRQSLCLCFKDFEGVRCARSFLPKELAETLKAFVCRMQDIKFITGTLSSSNANIQGRSPMGVMKICKFFINEIYGDFNVYAKISQQYLPISSFQAPHFS